MAKMLRFEVKPQFSSCWTRRVVDYFRFRRGTYHIPVLGSDEGKVPHLTTPVPEDAGLRVPLKPQKRVCQQDLDCRLLQLPPELLIHIMFFLPYSSLYMVSQTCQALRNLSKDFQFDRFWWEVLEHERPSSFTSIAVCNQLRTIKRIFLRTSLCTSCGELADSGELEERLTKLWQSVDCTGCQVPHPELLFPQGGRAQNICVGLLGKFAPCQHVKVSGKAKVYDRKGVVVVCSHPEHFPIGEMTSMKQASFNRYRPRVEFTSGNLDYTRSFPLVEIAPQLYPGMPVLKLQLFKRLQATHPDGFCRHASTQLESIVSSLPSDKCHCFPVSGPPTRHPRFPPGPRYWCNNHGYDCRHCRARYFWFYDNEHIVLHVRIHFGRHDEYSMGWLSNITFPVDKYGGHPILNESTKGVLWCNDPSCGTGCGNRWLLMVEIMKRASLRQIGADHEGVPPRDISFGVNLPFTLEYQIFQDAEGWRTDPGMLRHDLRYPRTTERVSG